MSKRKVLILTFNLSDHNQMLTDSFILGANKYQIGY